MARRLQDITNEPIQTHRLQAEGISATITLRYVPQVQTWFADVECAGKSRYGVRLALGTLHIESANMPIDLVVRDTSDIGIDPTRRDDFSTGRCELLVLMPDDMEEVRGGPVPLRA
jgi:hypothetical protein